jgi:hypothetical protein
VVFGLPVEYPRVRAFKITIPMDEWLIAKAKGEHRKVGDMIRILLMRIMEEESEDTEFGYHSHG